MRSNNNRLRQAIRQIIKESMESAPNVSTSDKLTNLKRYVEDNIDFTGYDEYENTPKSQYIQAAIDIFNEEKGWDIKRQGLRRAFIDWLRGLPSILNLATYYDEIRNLLYALGYDEVKDMEDLDIDKLYYNELFKVFFNK